jgi:benzodiazapine receptor
MKTYVRLVVSVALCEAAGIIGSLFTTAAINSWYAGLRRPAFAPPNWVFAPVWTTLYLLMGISLFMVWKVGLEKRAVKKSIVIFAIQLLLNILWSYLFFGLRSPLMGFIEIVVMWLMILLTILSFFKISKKAALLLVPYLAWVSIASYLNYSILVLNP